MKAHFGGYFMSQDQPVVQKAGMSNQEFVAGLEALERFVLAALGFSSFREYRDKIFAEWDAAGVPHPLRPLFEKYQQP
jgi:hypothetical protein